MVFDDLLNQKTSPEAGQQQESEQEVAGVSTDTQAAVDLFSSEISFNRSARDVELEAPTSDVLGGLAVAPEPDITVEPEQQVAPATATAQSSLEQAIAELGLDLSQFDFETKSVSGIVSGLGGHLAPALAAHAAKLAGELTSAFVDGQAISRLEQTAHQEAVPAGSVEILTRGIESYVALVGTKFRAEIGED